MPIEKRKRPVARTTDLLGVIWLSTQVSDSRLFQSWAAPPICRKTYCHNSIVLINLFAKLWFSFYISKFFDRKLTIFWNFLFHCWINTKNIHVILSYTYLYFRIKNITFAPCYDDTDYHTCLFPGVDALWADHLTACQQRDILSG